MSAISHDLPRALTSSSAVVLGILLSGFVIGEPAPCQIYMGG
ncbi:hypothetical protein O7A70_13275 [Mesorhizobium sp. Cs1299R1N1]